MSGVKDAQAAGIRHLDTIRRRHEREAKHLESTHQTRKAEMGEAHKNEIVDLRTEHKRQVDQDVEKKEKILNELQTNLDQTRRLTDKEILELKGQTQKVRAIENDKLAAERMKTKGEHDLYLEELNYKFNENAQKVNEVGRTQVEKIKDLKQGELVEKESYFKKKIHDQTETYTARIQREGNEYQKIKNDQDRQFKSERMSTNQRQQLEVGKMTEHHNKTIQDRDQVFRKGIKDQDLMFEKKYAVTLNNHNENLGRLDEKNKEVVNRMKDHLGKQINTAANKKDDPFYEFTELKPQLTNTPDGIIIKVAIPEHSKQDVSLSLNNKEAIINYTRRHNDVRKTADATSKLQKVESFSTRLMTDHILNPKTVKSSYADGVMTYTVSKA